MPRALTSGGIAALSAQVVDSAYFFDTTFDMTPLRLWSGLGSISWEGNTYNGDGRFLGLGSVRESLDSVPNGITIEVSGVSEELIALVLQQSKQSNRGSVYLVFFNSAGVEVDSTLLFKGSLDRVEINRTPTSGIISLAYESNLIRAQRSRELRLSNEAQQKIYPGDKGFEYVTTLQSSRIYWGRADPGRIRV